MISLTDEDLSQGTIDLWYSWLRHALIAYTRDDSVAARYRAFAPLVVDPQSPNPASEIVDQVRTVPVQRSGVVESASTEALRNWSLPADGCEAAALLIGVAARLGGRGVADAIWSLMARSGDLPTDERANLAFVAVQAAVLRFKFNEIISLLELLWSEDLATPRLLATLAALLSRKDHGGLAMMPVTLVKAIPSLVEEPHSGNFVRDIHAELRQIYGPEDLVSAFAAIQDEEAKTAQFRSVLRALSRGKNVLIFPDPISPRKRQRATSRLSGMANVLGADDFSSLEPPVVPHSGANDGADRS